MLTAARSYTHPNTLTPRYGSMVKISPRHAFQYVFPNEYSRDWMVGGPIVYKISSPDFTGVKSLGSCFLLPKDFIKFVDMHAALVSDLNALRLEHPHGKGTWYAKHRRITSETQENYVLNGKPKRVTPKFAQAVLHRVDGGEEKSFFGVGKIEYREVADTLAVCADRDKPSDGSIGITVDAFEKLVEQREEAIKDFLPESK